MTSRLVLLVDDDPSQRRLYNDILKYNGYLVVQAADGQDCLNFLYGNTPSLVVLDIMMPGIDGIECCRQIRKSKPIALPILLHSAVFELDLLAEALKAGADDYLVKSGSPKKLLERVRHWTQSGVRQMTASERDARIAEIEKMKAAGATTLAAS
ncbi:MAG TPA: response regulator [Alphaproteobacteria bacterium]|nr:response regulator [Alphaproteobacteria bacterium]